MNNAKLAVGRSYFAFDDVQVSPVNEGDDRFLLDVRKNVTRDEYVDLLEAASKALDLSTITMELKMASRTLRFVGCQVTPRQRDSDHCYLDVRAEINAWQYKAVINSLIEANNPTSTTSK